MYIYVYMQMWTCKKNWMHESNTSEFFEKKKKDELLGSGIMVWEPHTQELKKRTHRLLLSGLKEPRMQLWLTALETPYFKPNDIS